MVCSEFGRTTTGSNGFNSPNGQPYTLVNANQLMGEMADVVLAKP